MLQDVSCTHIHVTIFLEKIIDLYRITNTVAYDLYYPYNLNYIS